MDITRRLLVPTDQKRRSEGRRLPRVLLRLPFRSWIEAAGRLAPYSSDWTHVFTWDHHARPCLPLKDSDVLCRLTQAYVPSDVIHASP